MNHITPHYRPMSIELARQYRGTVRGVELADADEGRDVFLANGDSQCWVMCVACLRMFEKELTRCPKCQGMSFDDAALIVAADAKGWGK